MKLCKYCGQTLADGTCVYGLCPGYYLASLVGRGVNMAGMYRYSVMFRGGY
jgi:hypothetical protein